MSEQEKKQEVKKPQGRPQQREEDLVRLVRILSKDIRGDKGVYIGLCSIAGVSWGFSNAICHSLKLDKDKKIQDLTQEEIKKIEQIIINPKDFPKFMFNRRNDRDSGVDKHVYGADLGLQVDFDIKRLRKIKAYKGIRHQLGQPVRGQRTKSHFRRNKKKSGMSSKTPVNTKAKAPVAPAGGKK
jgi:small subunit ribosomal protein S13